MKALNYPRVRSAHFRIATSTLVSAIAVLLSGAASAAPDIIVNYLSPDPVPQKLSISADGRYIAYRAAPTSSGSADIMLYDVQTGTRTQANLTVTGGVPTGAQCDVPAMSADAHFVVFGCFPAALGVTVTGNAWQQFIYDRVANKTQLLPQFGSEHPSKTFPPAISKDGHYIAYRAQDPSGMPLFVRNMFAKSTVLTSAKYTLPSGPFTLNISENGRYVGYSGRGSLSSGVGDAWVYDGLSGATELINVSTAGVHGTKGVVGTAMSADGKIIAFLAMDSSLVTPSNTPTAVYLRDRTAGTTTLASLPGITFVNDMALSSNGRYVAYTANPVQTAKNLYVYDRLTKVTRIVPGAVTNTRTASSPAFSADGRYLVWESIGLGTGFPRTIGYADLGAAAGLSLSPAPQSLTEGGAAGTYTAVLTQVPSADVTVTVKPDKQLSVARTQLTFTPENWNVSQVISVQALQDNIVEGLHSGTVTHTVTSSDVNYTVIPTSSVTLPINDAVVPTIILPGTPWHQSSLPLTGVASPGATVLLTCTNRATGALTSVSVLVDAKGNWSYTLTGLTDDTYDLDAQADGINSAVKTVTISLLPTFTDVTSSITTTAYGLVFNRSTGKFAGNFVLTNSGGTALTAPLQLELDNLTTGVSLANASGSHVGAPFITLPGGLAPGASVTVPLLFNNPAKGAINYSAKTFAGSF